MRELFHWVFSPFVLIGALVIALLLLSVTIGLAFFSRPQPTLVSPSTAVVNVISAPTDTPVVPTAPAVAVATPTSAATVGPTLPPPPPGTIELDAYVQITGTGGDGLRLRTDPGLNAQVRLLGAEAEVFQVKDGPKEVDGYTWWYLVGPYDATRRGWAVSNFLQIVQPP